MGWLRDLAEARERRAEARVRVALTYADGLDFAAMEARAEGNDALADEYEEMARELRAEVR